MYTASSAVLVNTELSRNNLPASGTWIAMLNHRGNLYKESMRPGTPPIKRKDIQPDELVDPIPKKIKKEQLINPIVIKLAKKDAVGSSPLGSGSRHTTTMASRKIISDMHVLPSSPLIDIRILEADHMPDRTPDAVMVDGAAVNSGTPATEPTPVDNPSAGKIVSRAVKEEETGTVDFKVVVNDGSDVSMILLSGLRAIFQTQLPNMPKEYIARLVYDPKHVSMVVVKFPLLVLGGITYRPFGGRDFAEIVFCAISSTEQVQGYGARLMSHVKDHVKTAHGVRHFLTYADNYAIGYFKKQGFTTDINIEKALWMGYIKDYEGGTIMECKMLDKISYLETANIIASHRQNFKDLESAPSKIPGLIEAGWTPDASQKIEKLTPRQRGPLYIFMKKLVEELQESSNSWPFVEPVSGVADYYDVIKNPMGILDLQDLKTLESNVEADVYTTSAAFYNDVNLIFINCRTYNEDGSNYVKWY